MWYLDWPLRIGRGNRTIRPLALSALPGHTIYIGMLGPRTIFKCNRKLTQQQVPTSQHSILITELLQPSERTVIRTKGKLSPPPPPPPQIRSEMRAHHHCRQHFPACRAVAPLRKPETAAGIHNNHLSIVLQLIQNPPPPPTANKLASVSSKNRPSSVGKPRIGALMRQAFRASNAVC